MPSPTRKVALRNGQSAWVWPCDPVAVFYTWQGRLIDPCPRTGLPFVELWTKEGHWLDTGEEHSLDVMTELPGGKL